MVWNGKKLIHKTMNSSKKIWKKNPSNGRSRKSQLTLDKFGHLSEGLLKETTKKMHSWFLSKILFKKINIPATRIGCVNAGREVIRLSTYKQPLVFPAAIYLSFRSVLKQVTLGIFWKSCLIFFFVTSYSITWSFTAKQRHLCVW